MNEVCGVAELLRGSGPVRVPLRECCAAALLGAAAPSRCAAMFLETARPSLAETGSGLNGRPAEAAGKVAPPADRIQARR